MLNITKKFLCVSGAVCLSVTGASAVAPVRVIRPGTYTAPTVPTGGTQPVATATPTVQRTVTQTAPSPQTITTGAGASRVASMRAVTRAPTMVASFPMAHPGGTTGGGGGTGTVDLSNFYTIPQTDTLLDAKQDKLIPGDGVTIGSDGTISVNAVGGAPGLNGREVQLQSDGTFIQWKYADDTLWNDLVPLSDLRGATGAVGVTGAVGAAGADGKNIELQVVGSVLQSRPTGGTWTNLVDLSTIGGGITEEVDPYTVPTLAQLNAAEPGAPDGDYILGVFKQGSTIVRKWIKVEP